MALMGEVELECVGKPWGYYRVLVAVTTSEKAHDFKLKELCVYPGKSLSMQRHFKRSEYWYVSEGSGSLQHGDPKNSLTIFLKKDDVIYIPQNSWHQLENNGSTILKIIELQVGKECIEEDIERK